MCGQEEGGDDSSLWWLGVLMSIFASIASNLGVNVQKYSMMREAKRGPGRQRPYVAQPIWFWGLLLVIAGSIGDFAALGFAAQSLITPVGGFTMVANVVFAHFWLGEHLSRLDLVGTSAVVVGVILIAAFASKEESCFDLDGLIALYGEASFLVYAAFVVSSSLALYAVAKYCERVFRECGAASLQYRRLRRYHQFIYPTLSGVLGAQSVLFAKSTAELVKSAFRGDSPFASVMTYIIIVCMFSTIFMQLHWLAVALQWFDAVYCIPVFQCFFITVTIFGGALYFQELAAFSKLQMAMFPVGVLVTIGGILLLSQRQHKHGPLTRLRAAANAVLFTVRVKRSVYAGQLAKGVSPSPFFTPAAKGLSGSVTIVREIAVGAQPSTATMRSTRSAGSMRALSHRGAVVNTTHAPLPTGVALAEGLVSVASFVLPASVHDFWNRHTHHKPGSVAPLPGANNEGSRRSSAPVIYASGSHLSHSRRAGVPGALSPQLSDMAGATQREQHPPALGSWHNRLARVDSGGSDSTNGAGSAPLGRGGAYAVAAGPPQPAGAAAPASATVVVVATATATASDDATGHAVARASTT